MKTVADARRFDFATRRTPKVGTRIMAGDTDVLSHARRVEAHVRSHATQVPKHFSSLFDTFSHDYECLDADEPATRAMAYRLRYTVYCVENTYEDPARCVGEMEMDEFDAHAPHKILIHRPTGLMAGVVRIILPANEEGSLPVFRLLDRSALHGRISPGLRVAEVSRFAVVRQFRRDAQAAAVALDHSSSVDTRSPLMLNVSLGLMRAIVELAAANGVSYLCAVMEPALLRMLSRLGVHFQPLGPKVEYHGIRQPCFADLGALLARAWSERRDVWEVLTGGGLVWPLEHGSARRFG